MERGGHRIEVLFTNKLMFLVKWRLITFLYLSCGTAKCDKKCQQTILLVHKLSKIRWKLCPHIVDGRRSTSWIYVVEAVWAVESTQIDGHRLWCVDSVETAWDFRLSTRLEGNTNEINPNCKQFPDTTVYLAHY
jgi:hypothetical protein